MHPFLSIVVPMYNGKKVIASCAALLEKLRTPHEILIVDDGSADGSLAFCEEQFGVRAEYEFVRRDAAGEDSQSNRSRESAQTLCRSRLPAPNTTSANGFRESAQTLRLLHQENGGVCSARNTGLENARGDFLLFVDQDDAIVPEVIDQAVSKLWNSDADLLLWSTVVESDGQQAPCDTVYHDTLAEQENIRETILPAMLYMGGQKYSSWVGHVWSALFRRQVVVDNHLRFRRFVDAEDDYLFLFDYLLCSRKALFLASVGYHWHFDRRSASHKLHYIPDMPHRYERLFSYLEQQCRQNGITIPPQFATYCAQTIIVFGIENCASAINPDRRQELAGLKQRLQEPLTRTALQQPSVQPYEGRRKRIFTLVRHGFFLAACQYEYLDSRYRQLRRD